MFKNFFNSLKISVGNGRHEQHLYKHTVKSNDQPRNDKKMQKVCHQHFRLSIPMMALIVFRPVI